MGTANLNLFCGGAPVEDEVNLSYLEGQALDLTVPLKGGKVHGSLARAGKVRDRLQRSRLAKRRRRKLAEPSGGFSMLGGLSMWSKPLEAERRDQTPTRNKKLDELDE